MNRRFLRVVVAWATKPKWHGLGDWVGMPCPCQRRWRAGKSGGLPRGGGIPDTGLQRYFRRQPLGGVGGGNFSLHICPKFRLNEAVSRWKGVLSIMICDSKGVGEIQRT